MKEIVVAIVALLAIHPAGGQGEKVDRKETPRERFEEALRWKLSTGDPSGDTKIEVSGRQIRITLTGNKSWNEATAAFDAKYFGLLCLLWDTEARDEDPREYVLRDGFEVTLVQEPERVVAKALLNRADFPTTAELNTAILLTKSQVRDILRGQAVQANAGH
jgi:hypothetical protein